MKTLFLFRHAKSSWDDPQLTDHDRPLKPRGIKAARRMGRFIRDHSLHPELILCSSALRARETIKLALEESGTDCIVEYSEQFFHCAPSQFSDSLRHVKASIASVMIVGHNPGLEEFLFQLTGQPETIPTAALTMVEVDISDWSQMDEQTGGRLLNLWRPKELDE